MQTRVRATMISLLFLLFIIKTVHPAFIEGDILGKDFERKVFSRPSYETSTLSVPSLVSPESETSSSDVSSGVQLADPSKLWPEGNVYFK